MNIAAKAPSSNPKEVAPQGNVATGILAARDKLNLATAPTLPPTDSGLCRLAFVKLVNHNAFESVVLGVVLFNTVVLAVSGPSPAPGSSIERFAFNVDLVCLQIYTIEALLKMAAYGIWHPHGGYFKSGWCLLDFTVVVTTWVDVIMTFVSAGNSVNLQFLRVLRVLRPLRTASKLKAAQEIVQTLVSSAAELASVFAVAGFLMLLMAVLGLNLFGLSGSMQSRCFTPDFEDVLRLSSPLRPCSNLPGSECPEGDTCAVYPLISPVDGILGFNDFGRSLLTTMIVMFQDGVMQAASVTDLTTGGPSWAFFVVVTLFGSLFLLQLTVAVVCHRFIDIHRSSLKGENIVPYGSAVPPRKLEQDVALVVPPVLKDPPPAPDEEQAVTQGDPFKNKLLRAWPPAVWACSRMVAFPNKVPPPPAGGTIMHAESNKASLMEILVILHIIANAAVIAQTSEASSSDGISSLEIYFGVFFLVEVIIRIIAFAGPIHYLKAGAMNIFDIVVVFLTTLSLLLRAGSSGGTGPNFTLFRTIRLLRILLLVRRLKGFHRLMVRAFGSIGRIAAAIGVTLFFFSLICMMGQQAYDGIKFEDGRTHFNSFLGSFLELTRFATGVGMLNAMHVSVESSEAPVDARNILSQDAHTFQVPYMPTKLPAILFTIVAYFGINFVFLKIFVAVVLEHFEEPEADKVEQQLQLQRQILKLSEEVKGLTDAMVDIDPHVSFTYDEYKFIRQHDGSLPLKSVQKLEGKVLSAKDLPKSRFTIINVLSRRFEIISRLRLFVKRVIEQSSAKLQRERLLQVAESVPCTTKVQAAVELLHAERRGLIRASILTPAQRSLRRLFTAWTFELVIAVVVLASTALVVLEDREHTALTSSEQLAADVIFAVVFSLEFVLKIYAFGLVEYCASSMNLLDFVVLLTMLLDFIVGGLGALRSLRILRVARPLRFLSRFPSARATVGTLGRAVGDIFNIVMVIMLLAAMFALIGLDLFRGAFGACNNQTVKGYADCFGQKSQLPDVPPQPSYIPLPNNPFLKPVPTTTNAVRDASFLVPNAWTVPLLNYDDFGSALRTSLLMITNMDWTSVMYSATDATTAPGTALVSRTQPLVDGNMEGSLYFLVFHIVVTIFLQQLVFAVAIDAARMSNGSGILTESQRVWRATSRQITATSKQFFAPRAVDPKNWRSPLYFLSIHAVFEAVLTGVVIVNVAVLAAEYYGQNSTRDQLGFNLSIVFLSVYIAEMIVRILGQGLKVYLSSPANMFDLFVNTLSLVETAILTDSKVGLQVFRALKAVRILRLLRHAKRLQLLLTTVYESLAFLLSTSFILLSLMMVYSVLGSNYFGPVKEGQLNGVAISFRGFFPAMATLYSTMVQGSWVSLLPDLSVKYPSCTPDSMLPPNLSGDAVGDCGWDTAWIFFLTYGIIIRYFIIPLFVAMPVNVFFDHCDSSKGLLTEDVSFAFQSAWESVDRTRKGWIQTWHIPAIVSSVCSNSSFQLRQTYDTSRSLRLRHVIKSCVAASEKRIYNNDPSFQRTSTFEIAWSPVHFDDVLTALLMEADSPCAVDPLDIVHSDRLISATSVVATMAYEEVVRNVVQMQAGMENAVSDSARRSAALAFMSRRSSQAASMWGTLTSARSSEDLFGIQEDQGSSDDEDAGSKAQVSVGNSENGAAELNSSMLETGRAPWLAGVETLLESESSSDEDHHGNSTGVLTPLSASSAQLRPSLPVSQLDDSMLELDVHVDKPEVQAENSTRSSETQGALEENVQESNEQGYLSKLTSSVPSFQKSMFGMGRSEDSAANDEQNHAQISARGQGVSNSWTGNSLSNWSASVSEFGSRFKGIQMGSAMPWSSTSTASNDAAAPPESSPPSSRRSRKASKDSKRRKLQSSSSSSQSVGFQADSSESQNNPLSPLSTDRSSKASSDGVRKMKKRKQSKRRQLETVPEDGTQVGPDTSAPGGVLDSLPAVEFTMPSIAGVSSWWNEDSKPDKEVSAPDERSGNPKRRARRRQVQSDSSAHEVKAEEALQLGSSANGAAEHPSSWTSGFTSGLSSIVSSQEGAASSVSLPAWILGTKEQSTDVNGHTGPASDSQEKKSKKKKRRVKSANEGKQSSSTQETAVV